MDETERQILAKLCGKEDASEAEVTGLEYWDEADNMTTSKTCRAPRFLIVDSHLVPGRRFRVGIYLRTHADSFKSSQQEKCSLRTV